MWPRTVCLAPVADRCQDGVGGVWGAEHDGRLWATLLMVLMVMVVMAQMLEKVGLGSRDGDGRGDV